MAGKGALRVRSSAGARRGRASPARAGANRLAREADLVIVVGSRLSDFTTASKTAFQHPDVRFVNVNITEFDAGKHQALPLVGDARATLDEWLPLMAGLADVGRRTSERVAAREGRRGSAEVDRVYAATGAPVHEPGAR